MGSQRPIVNKQLPLCLIGCASGAFRRSLCLPKFKLISSFSPLHILPLLLSDSPLPPCPCFTTCLSASQWLHSLHPDVFVNIEYNTEAGGPFLMPRVKELFDFYAVHRAFHDTMFASHHGESSITAVSRLQRTVGPHGGEQQAERKSSYVAFHIAAPEYLGNSAVQSFESPNFRKQLDRSLTITNELFASMRHCLNTVAVEGAQRFNRPWSHQRWVRELRRHGFAPPPWAHAVGSQVCRLMQPGLPDAVRVTTTDEGLVIAFCGRDTVHATLWSVDEGHTGLSSGLGL